jgi:hypothetical protein
VAFYRGRYADHRSVRGLKTPHPAGRKPRSCPDARWLADEWAKRSLRARQLTERWLEVKRERTLRDFDVRPGYSGYQRAVQEVQRAYPGTSGWLLSCASSEGGWGRWVPNSQGSGAGGWLQFMESTFWRMFWAAKADVEGRGYLVPASAASWYSPLGQALAGAWGVTNGRSHEWAGHGCGR